MAFIKKLTAVLASAAMASSMASLAAGAAGDGSFDDSYDTAEAVLRMGVGINLGNTFEACGDWINDSSPKNYETAWGSVEITKDIIDGYKDAGFKSLRIPVAWSNMMSDGYTVSDEYLARVKQVVSWAIDDGLYVVLNEHWDGGWIANYPTDPEGTMDHFASIWTKVAEEFRDFDDHLIFEAQNEELGAWRDTLYNYWTGVEAVENGKALSYQYVKDINQKFVDIVRASGGNNAKRHLLISGYTTDIVLTCDEMFEMPDDPANRLALSVHYYTPFSFTHETKTTWGTASDIMELNEYMDMMYDRFVTKGVPVIIGECGFGTELATKEPADVKRFIPDICLAARARNMCPMLWDITYSTSQNPDNQIYNRRTCTAQHEEIQAKLNAIGSKLTDEGKELYLFEGKFENNDKVVKFNDAGFDLGLDISVLKATADGKTDVSGECSDLIESIKPYVSYTSSNEKVAKVDENGKVEICGAGTATIYADIPENFLNGDVPFAMGNAVKTTVKVEKLAQPDNTPEDKMTVPYEKATNKDIELPEGWSWAKKVDLPVGEPTVCRAVYVDQKNFENYAVNIEITRLPESASDSSSATDSTSSADSSSSSTSSTTSSSSSSSTASTTSATTTTSTTTKTTTTTTNTTTDASPSTGAGAGLTGIAAVLFGAAIIVMKKSKK